jgi:diacylglycerol kinase
MMLLSENFMETQLFNSQKEAFRLTFETLVLAIICSLFMGWETVQKFVLLRPELTIVTVAIVNFALSRYTGLRLLEHWRFQSIIEKKS